MALDATVGGVAANSYSTRAEAQTYFDARLYTEAWDAVDDTEKDAALQMATRLLDQYVEWYGAPATTTQRLAWPRYGMLDRNGNSIGGDVLPGDLKVSTAELALRLLERDSTKESEAGLEGLTQLTTGPVSMSFKSPIPARVIAESVRAFVALWGDVTSGAGMTIPLARV
jgi:hypothetical protein